MNDYSHALLKEISAQLLGYNPSHVWGKIARPTRRDAKNKAEYLSIMRSREPHHLRQDTKAYKHVAKLAKKYISSIPSTSHVKKSGFSEIPT